MALKACGGVFVTRSAGVGWDKGEAGGRSGGGGHSSGDEGYAADDVSGYEMSGGRGFAEVFPAVDEREQGGQIAKNGQGVFGDRVIRVDYLPDNGCRPSRTKAMHIIPNDITTGPATYLAGSVPMPSTKAP